jgi:hypothetical protein
MPIRLIIKKPLFFGEFARNRASITPTRQGKPQGTLMTGVYYSNIVWIWCNFVNHLKIEIEQNP